MKHQKIALIFCVIISVISVDAQELLWPMAGKKAGENILYKPQAYIDNKQVFDQLFIGGEEGDIVLCPVDGMLSDIDVSYMVTLDEYYSFDYDTKMTMDENIATAKLEEGIDRKNISIGIGIVTDKGHWAISGLKGGKRFRSGEKISAGDTLGIIGHSYRNIKEPSIVISTYDLAGKPKDPMTPFGLESSFVAFGELKRDNPMSEEKICEDLEVLKQAFIEIYPSLEAHTTKEEWSAYIDSLKTTITSPMNPSFEFRMLLQEILHKMNDSHLAMMPDPIVQEEQKKRFSSEILSLCDDTVRVAATTKKYEQYLWRIVTHINGESVMKYVEERKKMLSNYDEQVESTVQEALLLMQNVVKGKEAKEHILTFDDGTTATLPLLAKNEVIMNDKLAQMFKWRYRNRQTRETDFYETRELNDSTSYLGIKTFDIPDKQIEDIKQYLDTCKSNLIIDVRNNYGGENSALYKIMSFLTDKPMSRQKGGYHRVSKKGRYDMLKYSANYPPDIELYSDYEQGENGCYKRDSIETLAIVMPDTAVNYRGKIYVLTNGSSFSAAMLLPSVLVRNRRGVSVGRETGSAYHRMACMDQTEIRLPNTLQTISIPMVQTVFDTTLCERVPMGRGLMPDYPMSLTFYEITDGGDGKTDVMLEYALKLIAEGRYLSETDPFEQSDREEEKSDWWWMIVGALGVAGVGGLGVLYERKRKGREG